LRIEAQSQNGSISVDDDWVTIVRKNVILKNVQKKVVGDSLDKEKKIAISSIVAVNFRGVGKYGSIMGRLGKTPDSKWAPTTGLIQFVVLGQDSKRGLIAAQFDENSLQFNGAGQPDFERVRDFIQQRINERR
jgi:hypothetical protein